MLARSFTDGSLVLELLSMEILIHSTQKMHRESEFFNQIFLNHAFLFWIHTQPRKNTLEMVD